MSTVPRYSAARGKRDCDIAAKLQVREDFLKRGWPRGPPMGNVESGLECVCARGDFPDFLAPVSEPYAFAYSRAHSCTHCVSDPGAHSRAHASPHPSAYA